MSLIHKVGVVTSLGSVVLLCACSPASEPDASPQTQPTPEEVLEATRMAPAVPPAVSVNALMVSSIDHAAHVIWDAAVEPPADDEAWLDLEYHSIQIAAMGTLISLGGTGPADPGWARLPDWARYSQTMTDIGVTALQAARAMDMDVIRTAGDSLVETCEACHMEFKPDSPTEGLTHTPHYPR